ncbi:MAG: DUF5666 domain-containing protein [Candidatus Acidiferrales bacterium]
MHFITRRIADTTVVIALAMIAARTTSAGATPTSAIPAQSQTQAQSPLTQQVGTVKAINGNTLTLASDAGAEVTVTVQDTTKIVQVAPGSKDLKSAVAIHLTDLQPGDRILVRSRPSPDGKSGTAVGIIAMKATDVAAKKTQETEDWQKHGIGGLVSAVDPATGTITISTGAGPTAKTVAVHTTKNTVLRRYAPDSVKFDDAKSAPLDQIKPGDQLRARGTRNADGSEFQADEIVWGTFRNIAGIIISVDPSANTITLTDLITKKPVAVKITDQSQLRKLPERMAQFIAIRLKGAGGGAPGAAPAATQNSSPTTSRGGAAAGTEGASNGGQHAGGAGGGRADFQQIVNRLPPATLSDFQKGDAIMVVSTQGTDSGGVTAITLLGGVEPILAAAPAGNASQAMTLSPWSLGAPTGDAAGGTQ